MKQRHYVTRWLIECRLFTTAACGIEVNTLWSRKEAAHRKNHVTCKNCRRTKAFNYVR